jgi:undecaprenyl-diphosphatase
VSLLEAIVLGIVQGLTEFLPISSTGHLRVVPAFLGWEDPGAAFTAITQLGTMLAVVIYFRADLVRIAGTWLRSLREPRLRSELDARMGWYLIVATIPISIFGLAFEDQIETGARDLYLIGAALIVLGLILLLAERVGTRTRGLERVGRRDAIVVGFAQALALVPGVSRSGATITAGLFLGLERETAARFSFLLSIPAVVLSGLFQAVGLVEEPGSTGVVALVVATLFAFLAGYAAIAFLLRFLVTHTTKVFVAYRVVLGTVVIALTAAGVIS